MDFEKRFHNYIYIDEAGRGCIGGELVFTGVKVVGDVSNALDSKQTTFKDREQLIEEILTNVQHCTVITTAKEIDEIGLSKAISQSLQTIIDYFPNEKYLYDGNKSFGITEAGFETLIKADAKVKGVGAASIIAKTHKDRLMLEHHKEYPEYGWDSNFGYITQKHIDAIIKYGYTPYHRKSYKVKAIEEALNKDTTNIIF